MDIKISIPIFPILIFYKREGYSSLSYFKNGNGNSGNGKDLKANISGVRRFY